jgi:uncharacterized protein with GYD domain
VPSRGNAGSFLSHPDMQLFFIAGLEAERRSIMPYYVILSNLTDEGRKTIKERPERILEVNKEIEGMGVKVLKQYALLGMYDIVNIVEAASNEAVMKMSVEIGSRGSVQMTTLPAVPVEEFIKHIK